MHGGHSITYLLYLWCYSLDSVLSGYSVNSTLKHSCSCEPFSCLGVCVRNGCFKEDRVTRGSSKKDSLLDLLTSSPPKGMRVHTRTHTLKKQLDHILRVKE